MTISLLPPYEPSRKLSAKIARRLTPFQAKRVHKFTLNRPVISITFDDFPISSFDNGAKRIEQENWRGTFYVATGLVNTNNHHGEQFAPAHVDALVATGHEIAGHSHTHTDFTPQSLSAIDTEVARNDTGLSTMGVHTECKNFAYPYGATTPKIKTHLSKRYRSMRGILPIAHAGHVDLNQVGSFPLFSGENIDNALAAITALNTTPAWITLFAHDIRNTPSKWGCTPQDFEQVITAIHNSGADVLTVDAALDAIGAPNV